MDDFKIRNFLAAHPDQRPLRLERLAMEDAWALRERLRVATGLPAESTDLELARHIVVDATPIPNIDPRTREFEPKRVLNSRGIEASRYVYINWGRFDEIDRVAFDELNRFFTDIWYPDTDDIEIFDDSCAWILVVPHSGVAGLRIFHP